MEYNGSRYTGARRGVFGLQSWAPLREPGKPATDDSISNSDTQSTNATYSPLIRSEQPALQQQPAQRYVNHDAQSAMLAGNNNNRIANGSLDGSEKSANVVKPSSAPSGGQRLIAKYAYQANVDSPLGNNAELALSQLDKMSMIAPHAQQEFWWFVEMDDGRRGYVPANYVMPFEEKVTSLPWLANRPVEPLPPVSNQPYKPYKSAYDKDSTGAPAARQYFCEVCQKQLNGPQPYNAHMNSRAHRDEVELAGLYASA